MIKYPRQFGHMLSDLLVSVCHRDNVFSENYFLNNPAGRELITVTYRDKEGDIFAQGNAYYHFNRQVIFAGDIQSYQVVRSRHELLASYFANLEEHGEQYRTHTLIAAFSQFTQSDVEFLLSNGFRHRLGFFIVYEKALPANACQKG